MDKTLVDLSVDYPRTARSALSHDANSLAQTFERIRMDKLLPGVTRVTDSDREYWCARIELGPEEGSGYWEFLQLASDLYVIVADFHYKKTHAEEPVGEGFLEFHFKVSGELLLGLDINKRISVRGPSLLIWKQPSGVKIKEWINGGVRESSLTLYCKPDLFTEKLGLNDASLPKIVTSFIAGKNPDIEFEILPLNPALAFSITNLLRSNFADAFHVLHAKSKSYDLLLDTLLYLGSSKMYEEDSSKVLTEYEMLRLQEARDILSTQFNPYPTIRSLSKKIGINETKFKRGFKKLFGTTIHEYATYHRMQRALELLQTTHMPISHVAQTVGYEYQTSFTAAVKRFFGITPKQLRDNAFRR